MHRNHLGWLKDSINGESDIFFGLQLWSTASVPHSILLNPMGLLTMILMSEMEDSHAHTQEKNFLWGSYSNI